MKLSDLLTQFVPLIMDDRKGPLTLPPSTPEQVSLN